MTQTPFALEALDKFYRCIALREVQTAKPECFFIARQLMGRPPVARRARWKDLIAIATDFAISLIASRVYPSTVAVRRRLV